MMDPQFRESKVDCRPGTEQSLADRRWLVNLSLPRFFATVEGTAGKMHGIISLGDPDVTTPVLRSARGEARVVFGRAEDGTKRVAALFQEGCLKLRFPRPERDGAADLLIMNIAGLTGGDRLSIEVSVESGAHAMVTTPACEHSYAESHGRGGGFARMHRDGRDREPRLLARFSRPQRLLMGRLGRCGICAPATLLVC